VSAKKRTAIKPIYISLGMFAVLVAAFTAGDKSFLSIYNAQTILNAVAILLAVGLGQACVILTGGIDLSVGSIMSLVSVVFMLILGPLGPWAFPAVILIGLASGALNGLIVSKLKIPSFIATLGTQGILLSIAYLLSPGPLSVPDNANAALVDIVNGAVGPVKNVWIIGLAIFAIYFVLQRYSKLGRGIIYIGANERMSYLSGLDIDMIRLVAFSMSGLGAAIAGVVLSSTLYSGYPTIGGVYVLNSIAVVVVGGTAMTGGAGGMLNTLVGALIMGILNNGMTVVGIDVYAQQVFLGVLVIIAVAVTFDRKKLAIIK
jgi:ribose transport system permease protein